MENQLVRRRVNMIIGHFAGNEDVSATHLLPLSFINEFDSWTQNCSSSINSVIQRCDNRTLFARQGSISQASFMRQVSIKENFGQCNSVQHGVPPCSSGYINKDSSVPGAPLFSKPAHMKPEPGIVEYRPVNQECQLSMEEPPKFARPYRRLLDRPKEVISKKVKPDGIELSPSWDVSESGRCYVMSIEFPGVSIENIRVEVDEENLVVTGKRSTEWWRAPNASKDSILTYHKSGIVQRAIQDCLAASK
ncbi:hypothetical protein IFM89_023751 [Coptis chinensis]|uniref:SHSP domain-containing protein n=1 Tax=Coptis chinensis TaxID=261450 RepID=A0A835LBL7_9MAGN|nr:hypothetical protein IFM89_023751 [Coptis chinensis]